MSWKTRLHTHFSKLSASIPNRKAASTARTLDVLDLEDRVMYSAIPIDVAGLVEGLDAESLNSETQYDGFEVREPFITYLDQPTEPQNEASPEQDAVEQVPDDQTPDDPITEAEDDVLVTPEETPQRHELVFIDAAVEDIETLLEDLQLQSDSSRELSYVLLESGTDGIAQITAELADRDGIDAVHIVSHGSVSGVQLGSSWLTAESFSSYAVEFEQWDQSLADGGDLLFYGCDLAASEEGRVLMEQIGAACDCDVAASDDVTGHESLGGDWDLEFQAGLIQASNAFSATAQAHWLSTLDITSNLVAHYEFEENGGSTALDSTANSNDGAWSTAPSWSSNSAVGSYSMDFELDSGSNAFVSVPDHASLDISGDFSVAFWYNATVNTGSNQQLVGQYSVGDGFFVHATSSGSLQFLVDGASGIVNNQYAGAFINDGSWYHVVAVRSGDNFQMYLNGVANTASTSAIGAVTSTQPLLIGGTSSSDYEGKLDEVRLYTRALSPSDVTELYNFTGGTTFTVTNTSDSGAGSLRQAIIDANANAGADTIDFNIAGSGTQIIALSSALDTITEQVTIDGTTQTGWTEGSFLPIVLDGNNGAFDGLTFTANADNSEVRGLVIRDFGQDGIQIDSGGSGITVAGNWIGRYSSDGTIVAGEDIGQAPIRVFGNNNTIGGTTAADRNVIHDYNYYGGVMLDGAGSTGNTIAGNYFGTTIDGNSEVEGAGNFVGYGVFSYNGANTNTIGGATSSHRNIFGGLWEGVSLYNEAGDNNTIQNNWFGLGADGTTILYNEVAGVRIQDADNALISDNVFVGMINGDGIRIDSGTDGITIQGNYFGTDASETLVAGSWNAIDITSGGTNVTIGGVGAGEGNVIANSLENAIEVGSAAAGVAIRGNSIYANAGLGIDLGDDGPTPNDAGDADTGANNLQNWAVLTAAAINDAGTMSYSIDTNDLASGTYDFDFYASTDRDGGQVEGKRYLFSRSLSGGSTVYNLNESGVTLATGEYVTLVTTDTSGNSSEFSNYAVATDSDAGGATPSDLLGIATSEGGLSINEDGGNDAYLVADDGGAILGGRTNVSVEYRGTLTGPAFNSFVSYATPTQNNELVFHTTNDGRITVNIGGSFVTTTASYASLFDGNEHTISATWTNSGQTNIYIDGELAQSFTGHQTGYTIASGGTLVIAQEQDSVESSFDTTQVLNGIITDVRIFDDLRTATEIATSYRSDLPYDEDGMIANWRFDDLSSDGIVTEEVSGNNLTVKHTSESGFTASSPELTFSLDENAIDGTIVGKVSGVDAEREAQIASLLAADADLRYNAETGKFYKLVSSTSTWNSAFTAAQSTLLGGVGGELVTIQSAQENSLVHSFVQDIGNAVHLGGSDQDVEGEWRWYSGSTAGDIFWQGTTDGYNVNGKYENWNVGEPNNHTGTDPAGEAFLYMASDGSWNDIYAASNWQSSIVQWDADAVLDATQALTYSIQTQSVAGAFEVDADTGEIRVLDGTLLDADSLATHTITIRTTDVDTNTYDEAFSISLNDLAESNNAPTNLSSGIELNTDGGNDAYLQATDGGAVLGGLTSLTFETTFQVTETRGDNILIDYGTSSTDDAFQLTVKDYGDMFVTFNGLSGSFTDYDYSELLLDGQPHHFALTWDNTNGDIAIYIDGELMESKTSFFEGVTIAGGTGNGSLIFGNDQNTTDSSFDVGDGFNGTFYDIRIWNEVRSEAEISLNYQHKFDSGSLPSGLIANWQMDGFNGSSEVVDVVSGNNLSIGHATGTGFVASTPVGDLHISEHATDGTSVGYVVPSDPDVSNDIVSDGLFNHAGATGYVNVTTGQTIGGAGGSWTVISGDVDLEGGWESSPLGGTALGLDGTTPGAIEQSLTTVAGRQYQVVFALTGNFQGGNVADDLRVSADGVAADFHVDMPSGWTTTNLLWEHRSFTFTASDITTDLQFASLSASGGLGPVIGDIQVIEIPAAVTTILNNDPTLSYDAATGKFYKVAATGATIASATSIANADTINGVGGQLVTIRSAYENELVRALTGYSDNGYYIGATDSTTEGEWNWIEDGQEADRFWNGNASGSAANGAYAKFGNLGEPNGGTAENYATIRGSDGIWIDNSGLGTNRYIIEWDASEVLSSFTFSLTDDAGGRFAIDSSTGKITVADGSLLDYETATSHNVTVETTDAAGNTYSESMAIAIDNELDPNQTVPGAQTINEDATLTFTAGTATEVSVTDSIAGENSRMRVTLSVNDGVLTLSQVTGLTIVEGANGSGSFVIDGTESDINAALDGMTFTPDADFNGSVTLNISTALSADLEGHYTFEGGNANDQAAGTADDGTFVGDATTVIDPERGEVLSLDGDGDFVQVGGVFGDPQNLTLSGWINLSAADSGGSEVISLGNAILIRADATSSSAGLQLSYHDGSSFQHINTGINLAGTGWRHVAATFSENGSMTLYLDGEEIGQVSVTSIDWAHANSTGNTFIGAHGNSGTTYDFNGLIDDARIYSRALSADEIAAMVALQPTNTIGPDLTQAFGSPAGDNSGANLLFIHDQYAPITGHGTISSLQIGPDSNSTPIDFDLLVLRPDGGGGFEVIHRVSLTDSDILSTDGDGVRTLNIGKLDVQAGDVIGHWSANNAGSIPYTIGGTGATGWSTYGSTDVEVGDTVTESNDSTNARGYGIAFDFEPDKGSQSSDQVAITVGAVNDAPIFERVTNGTFDSDLTGWTTTGTALYSAENGGSLRFGEGNAVGPHTASQLISTVAGTTYELTFDYRDGKSDRDQSLQVTVDGSSNLLTTSQILTDIEGTSFVRYTYSFVADSDTSTITFTDTSDTSGLTTNGTAGVDGFVDNISVTHTSGPMSEVTFVEDGAAVVLDADVEIFDTDIDRGEDTFENTTLTLVRNGGTNSEDVFSATGLLGTLTEGGNLVYNSVTVGTVTTNSGGTLLLTFNAAADNDAINGVMQAIAYANSSDAPPASVQVDWTFNDHNDASNQGSGGDLTATGSTTVNITAVNDTPDVTGPGSAYSATEQTNLNIHGTGFSVTDVDAASGTMTATFVVGEGTITLAAGDSGVSIGANSASTVSFTGTLAQINALLTGTSTGTIVYNNGSDTPSASTTITLTVNDGGNTGSDPGLTADGTSEEDSAAQTINITATNDDPTNAGSLPSDVTVTEDLLTAVDLSAVDFSDVDAASSDLTVTLSTSTGGELTLAADASIAFGGTATARTLTGTLAELNAYFNNTSNIQYLHGTPNTFGNDGDTITVVVNDNGNTGTGGGTDQTLGTVNVDITAVNDEEVLATNTGTTVAEGSTGTAITTAMLHTTDVDNTDVQLVYTVDAIPANGTLRLNGTALGLNDTFTQADIDAGNVTYDHDGSQTASDSFDFTVDDGVGTTTSGTFNFTVSNVNDPPINTVPGAQSVAEDTSIAITGISVTDADDNLSTVQLTVGNGTLNVTLSGGASISAGSNGSGNLTLSGTLADINATLGSLTYQGNSNFNGSDTLTVLSTDSNSATDSDTVNITVGPVNDTPDVVGPGSAYSVNEQTNLNIHGTGFSVSDVDAASGTMTATIQVGEGAVTVAAGDSGVSLSSGNGTGTVILTGTLAQINNLLTGGGSGSIVYNNGSDTPSSSTTITVTVNDGGNTGSDPGLTANGTSEEDSASQTINLTATNDDPFDNGSLPADVTVTEDVLTAVDLSAVDFGDADAASSDLTVTLSTSTGGELTLAADASIAFGGTATSRTLTGTLAELNAYFNNTSNIQYLHSTQHTFGNDADTITVVINDGGNSGTGGGTDQTLGTVNVDITAVNDEPAGSDNTVTTNEDTDYAFAAADFGFSDPIDGDSLSAVVISTLPSNGTLYLDANSDGNVDAGEAVSASQAIAVADITAGRLKFKPAVNANGTSYDSFTFQVRDDGGTANGGVDTDQTPNTMAIDVNSVNDEPAGTDHTVTTNEDTDYAFAAGDFGFSDSDGNSLSAVVISTLPTNGTLYLDANSDGVVDGGEAVSATDAIAVADITAGRLKFKPAANANGTSYDSFTFQVRDDGGTANGGVDTDQTPNTMTIDVNSVNDEPAGADNTVATNEDTDYAFAAGDFGFSDSDGNSLSAVVISTLPTNGTLYLDANSDGVVDGGEAVSATDAIAVADITAGRLKFKPAANANGTSYDSFTFQVRDDGGTANGGVDTDQTPNTMTIDVNSVNDEPAGTDNTVTTNEDTDYAFAAGDFGFSDSDGNSLSAVVISTLPSNGTLYLDANSDGVVDGGEAVSATDAIAVADITAGRLKFKPAANANGTSYDSFTFQVRDDGGTANGGVDTDQTPNTMTIDVNSVNDEPAGADNTVATNEDTDYAFAAGDFGFSDSDGNSLSAVVISTLPTNGTLYLDANSDGVVDGGEAVSATDAIAVADITAGRLKFKPAAYANGTSYDSFTFQVRDDGGTANGGQDTDQLPNTITIDVTAVNDDPLNAGSLPTDIAVTEDVSSDVDLSVVNLADVDAGSGSLTLTLTTSTGGNLSASSGGGVTVSGSGTGTLTLDGTLANLNTFLDTASNIQYLHGTPGTNGDDADTIQVTITDNGNTGSGGGGTINLGTTNVDIGTVNDPPVNTVPGTQSVLEETQTTIAGISVADFDAGGSLITTRLQVSNGLLNVTLSGAATISAGANDTGDLTIQGSQTDINATLSSLTYTGNTDVTGVAADTLFVTTNDQGNTGGGGAQQDVDNVQIDITAVNDAPSVTGPGSAYNATEQTNLNIHGTGFSVTDVDAASGTMTATIQVGEGVVTLVEGDSGVTITANNSSTVSLTGTLTQINALLTGTSTGTIVYNNGSDTPSASTTITVTVNDGGNTGVDPGLTADGSSEEDSAAQVINLTATNDDPTNAGSLPTDITVTEDVLSNVDLSLVDFSDADAGSGSLTVSLTTSTGGQLTVSTGAGITLGGTATSRTFTGSLANLNAYFNNPANIQYLHVTPNLNGDNADTITVVVNDNGNTGSGGGTDQNLGVVNVDITSVNDRPTTDDTSASGAEDSVILITLTGSDIDGTVQSFEISSLPANGNLYLDAGLTTPAVQFNTYAATSEQLNVYFQPNANWNGVTSFTFAATDNQGLWDATPASATITVGAVNDAPNVTAPGVAYTVSEQTSLNIHGTGFSVSDVDAGTGTLTATLDVSLGMLSLVAGDSGVVITANNAGTVTFTGTLAQINSLLSGGSTGTIVYQDSSDTPSTSSTITLTVNDGGNTGTDPGLTGDGTNEEGSAAQTINIIAINDDPGNSGSLPTDIAVIEDVSSNVDLSLVDLADVDVAGGTLTLTLTTSTGGNLSASSGGGVTAGGSGTGVLTLSGTVASLNTYLDSASNISYLHGTPGTSGDDTDTIQVTVTDNGNTGSGGGGAINLGTVNVDIGQVNDPPVNSVPGTQTVLEETATSISGISIGDPDAGGNNLTTRLQVSNGVLNISLSGSATIVAGTSGSADLTIQGSQADINATLASLTYMGNTDVVGVAADLLTVTTNDLGNTGTGGPLQDVDTVQINITNVNDAPAGVSESFTTPNTQTLTVAAPGLLANDYDIDSPTLTAVLVSGPANGTLTLMADGAFVFQPSPAYFGPVQFTYVAYDGSLVSSPVTVTIDTTVAPGNPSDPEDPGDPDDGGGDDTTQPEDPVQEPTPVPSPTPPPIDAGPPQLAPPPSPLPVTPEPPAESRQEQGFDTISTDDTPREDDELSTSGSRISSFAHSGWSRPELSPLERSVYGTQESATYNLDLIEHWLDAAEEEQPVEDTDSLNVGTATSLAIGLSAGYIAWTIRGAYLVAAMAGALPTWVRFDPIYVLDDPEFNRKQRQNNDPDASLADLAQSLGAAQ